MSAFDGLEVEEGGMTVGQPRAVAVAGDAAAAALVGLLVVIDGEGRERGGAAKSCQCGGGRCAFPACKRQFNDKHRLALYH